jgi:hypothetical protein
MTTLAILAYASVAVCLMLTARVLTGRPLDFDETLACVLWPMVGAAFAVFLPSVTLCYAAWAAFTWMWGNGKPQ